MNKRQRKKKIKLVIENISKVNLGENDILVFKYDNSKYSVKTINDFANHIRNSITNKFVFIPRSFETFKVNESDIK